MSENLLHPNGSYTARQVAELVHRKSYEWFSRNHKRLRDEKGFPKPISSFGQPRWSGAALLHWMQTPRSASARTVAPDLTNVLDLRTALMLRGKRPASANGRPSDFDSESSRSNREAGAITKAHPRGKP